MLSPQTLHLPPLRDLHPPARNPRDRRPRPRPRTETQVVNDTETTAPPFRLPRVTLPRQPEPPVSAAEREAGDQALGLTERQRDQAALERLRAERQSGRGTGRERVCRDGKVWGAAGLLKEKKR